LFESFWRWFPCPLPREGEFLFYGMFPSFSTVASHVWMLFPALVFPFQPPQVFFPFGAFFLSDSITWVFGRPMGPRPMTFPVGFPIYKKVSFCCALPLPLSPLLLPCIRQVLSGIPPLFHFLGFFFFVCPLSAENTALCEAFSPAFIRFCFLFLGVFFFVSS